MRTRIAGLHRCATALLFGALAANGGCSAAAASDQRSHDTARPTAHLRCEQASVVLITLDGVRWQEVFHGVDAALADTHGLAAYERVSAAQLMPNLHRLASQQGAALGAGHAGPAMHASGPAFISLPGYTELMTGRTRAGCLDNNCSRVDQPTLLDELAADGCGQAAAFSSWEKLGNALSMSRQSVHSSVGRYAGDQRSALEVNAAIAGTLAAGARASAAPGEDDYRPDSYTGEAALSYLQASQPRFLFIGLGDTDEYGHADDYRAYLDALRRADALIGRVAQVVFDEIALGHRTTLLITTDHGRADTFVSHGAESPESSRVWLIAAGSGVSARGMVQSGRVRHLADIAPTIRELLGLPAVTRSDAGTALTELLLPDPSALVVARTRSPSVLARSAARGWPL